MSEADPPPVRAVAILWQSWRMLRTHLRTFVPLMGFPLAALALSVLVMYFFLVPIQPGIPLRDTWVEMGFGRKAGVFLAFVASVAVINQALAASIFAVREIHGGREIGILQALGSVHWKHVQLFWLLFLVGIFMIGPLALISLALGFFFAPAYPVAALEDLGVSASLRRSAALTKGGYGRIGLFFLIYLALVVAGAFGFVGLVITIQQFFGQGLFVRIASRLVFALAFWIFLLIPQFYMIALTLNYFDQRLRKGELSPISQAVP